MRKSILSPLLCLLLATGPLMSQVSQPTEELQALFNPELTQADLEKKISDGGNKFSASVALEARILWGIRNQDFKFLESLLPEMEKHAANFKAEGAVAFKELEEFQSLLHYTKAIQAKAKNDEAAFKANITEAFWLMPAQSGLFAQPIMEMRKELAMAKVKLDLDGELIHSDGKKSSLKAELGTNKAILIDFWASWCGPCMQLMPALQAKADKLSKLGISVVAMNTESDKVIAEKVKKEKKMNLPWLVEPEGGPYSTELKIDSIPRMILVNPEGKVLFNGHPEDPSLWEALAAVNPEIKAD